MVDRNDQDYPFIKETIKKRPVDKKAVIQRLLTAALCGIVFGVSAAAAIAAVMPSMLDIFEREASVQETVRLSPPAASKTEPEETVSVGQEETEVMSQNSRAAERSEETGTAAAGGEQQEAAENTDDLSGHIINVYNEIKMIAQEPQKALVRVSGIGETQDLLDHSSLTYGDEEGIVFLKNQEAFYILTVSENLGDSENYRVVFSMGDSAEGTLCGEDARTGLMVIRVPAKEIAEDAAENVPAVPLAGEADQEQADPVIAIGSPTGDRNTLIYGNITSVQGRYQIADAEYMMLTTDMVGSSDGGGVLLNMEGQITGIISADGEDKGTVIRAVSAVQLKPLLEMLSNGEGIRYLGILGETVTERQSKDLEIPQGVYVDGVEEDSPAMEAGIQSGDILYKIDGKEVLTMKEYTAALQKLTPGQKTKASLYRRNPSGEYAEVELKVFIEEQ